MRELEKFDEFNNAVYGNCYILDKTKDYYLIFIPNNSEKFAICSYIDKYSGAIVGTRYFKEISSVYEAFKEANYELCNI